VRIQSTNSKPNVTLKILHGSKILTVAAKKQRSTRKPSYNAKVSARQPGYIERNSLNRPPFRIA